MCNVQSVVLTICACASNLEHSTIIYETPDATPLLRLQWNKRDPNYLATFQMDSSKVIVLDVRVPSVPVTELHGHTAAVNAVAWAPHSASHLCTVGMRIMLWVFLYVHFIDPA